MYHKAMRTLLRRPFRLLMTVALLLASAGTIVAAAHQVRRPSQVLSVAAPNGMMKVYLPLVQVSSKPVPQPTPTSVPPHPTPTSVPPPTPTPPPSNGRAALYLDPTQKTASASAAVDANGNMHAAYVYFVPLEENPPAVYAFCPAPADHCNSPASWTRVAMGDRAIEVQLKLTAAGQPRMLIVADSTVYTGGKDYFYAACDSGCTNVANWTRTLIVSSAGTEIYDANDQNMPQHSFALDPQGRPRFLYQDRNYQFADPDHIGVFYVTCDMSCTNASSWQQTLISRVVQTDYQFAAEEWDYPALSFTPAGQPRVVANVITIAENGTTPPQGLYYYACDGGCNAASNWQRLFLLNPGSGSAPPPSWDIAVDSASRPQVAFFTGGAADGGLDYQLVYLLCGGNCLSGASWKGAALGLPQQDGQAPDIVVDSVNRPRIAYTTAEGDLGYAWCNSGCDAASESWQKQVIDSVATMQHDNPQAIPSNCDQPLWQGVAPVLALDGAGNPRIAHDVTVDARCYYVDPNDPNNPTIRFERVWTGVRWNYLPQP